MHICTIQKGPSPHPLSLCGKRTAWTLFKLSPLVFHKTRSLGGINDGRILVFFGELNLLISYAAKLYDSRTIYHNQIDETEVALTLCSCWNHSLLPASFWLTVKVKTRLSRVRKEAEKSHTCEETRQQEEDGKKRSINVPACIIYWTCLWLIWERMDLFHATSKKHVWVIF